MIFALLFFASFVAGLIVFIISGRWWLGGLIMACLLVVVAFFGFPGPSLRGVALYFGIPIVFLGSLFGAYIVQLRRAPELEQIDETTGDEPAADHDTSVDQRH